MAVIDELFLLDGFSEAYQQDPHGLNREALARGPVARSPYGVEVLSYEAVQSVLRDRRFASPEGLSLAIQGVTEGPLWDRVVEGILSVDGDQHQRLRRLVAQSFTPRAAERLRGSMQPILAALLDEVDDARACDVVELVRSYPIAIICELLGTPAEDWPLFSAWTDDIFKIFQMNVVEDSPAILTAFDALDAYLDGMAEARRREPRDDLITELIHAEDEGDRLTHSEMQMLAGAVLTAGTDTTRNQLAAAVEVFAAHPEQWHALADDPGLAGKAVEEVMRHQPVIFGTVRRAVTDVEVAGVLVPEGTLVSVNTSAANRDPAVYDEPDRFDLHRVGPPPHLTFGGGIHYCLGVHLAKAELAEALVLMAQRWPDLRVTGPVPWKPVVGISGPAALPVAF